MASAQGILRRAAHASTKAIAMTCGDAFPYYHVCEYPKSGGTWLARMVADCLQVPFPQNSVLPLGFSCVVQSHWSYSRRLTNAVYLHRDGRDVMVSYYFHRLRDIQLRESPFWQDHARDYERLFGKGYDPDDTARNLPIFIENEFARPRGARKNWADHVTSWLEARGREGVVFASYEGLLADCRSEMRKIMDGLGRPDVDDWKIDAAVEKFSMRRQTGRRAGQEDRKDFIRKGVAGDWKNHFTRECAERFNELAGEALVALGYVADKGWVARGVFGDDSGHFESPLATKPLGHIRTRPLGMSSEAVA